MRLFFFQFCFAITCLLAVCLVISSLAVLTFPMFGLWWRFALCLPLCALTWVFVFRFLHWLQDRIIEES